MHPADLCSDCIDPRETCTKHEPQRKPCPTCGAKSRYPCVNTQPALAGRPLNHHHDRRVQEAAR